MQNIFLLVLVMLVTMHPITPSNTMMQCTPVYLSNISSNSRPADLIDEYLLDNDFSGIQCCCSLCTRKKDRLGSSMENGRYCNIRNSGSNKLFFVEVLESCTNQSKPTIDIEENQSMWEVYKELCLTCKDSYPRKDLGLLCCIRAPLYSCRKFTQGTDSRRKSSLGPKKCLQYEMRDSSTLDFTSLPSISASRTARIDGNRKIEYERLTRNLKSITPIIELNTSSRAKQASNIKDQNSEGGLRKTILLRRLLSSIMNPENQLEIDNSSERRRGRIVNKRFKRGVKKRRRKRATTKSFIFRSSGNSQTDKEKVAYLDTLRLLNTSFSPEIKPQLNTVSKGDTESTKASYTTESLHKADITKNRIQVKQSSSAPELPRDSDITFNFASTFTTLAPITFPYESTKTTEVVAGSTEEYEETEQFYNEEYAEEDYADYEDKSTTFTPTWYDYESPEDLTTSSMKGETTTWETEFKKPLSSSRLVSNSISTISKAPKSTILVEKMFSTTKDTFLEESTETSDLKSISTSIEDSNVYSVSMKESPTISIKPHTVSVESARTTIPSIRTTTMSSELRSTKGSFKTTSGITVNETRNVEGMGSTGSSSNGSELFTILPASKKLTEFSEHLTRKGTKSFFESTSATQTEEFETDETESGSISTSAPMQTSEFMESTSTEIVNEEIGSTNVIVSLTSVPEVPISSEETTISSVEETKSTTSQQTSESESGSISTSSPMQTSEFMESTSTEIVNEEIGGTNVIVSLTSEPEVSISSEETTISSIEETKSIFNDSTLAEETISSEEIPSVTAFESPDKISKFSELTSSELSESTSGTTISTALPTIISTEEETQLETLNSTVEEVSTKATVITSPFSEELMTTINKPETSNSMSANEETQMKKHTNVMSTVTTFGTPKTSEETTSKKTDLTEEMIVNYTTESPTSRVFFTEATTVKSTTEENEVSEIDSSTSGETIISEEEQATLLLTSSTQTTIAPSTTAVFTSSLKEVTTERPNGLETLTTEESVETDVESQTKSSGSGFEKVSTEEMKETSTKLEGYESTEYINPKGTSKPYIISEATSIEAAPNQTTETVFESSLNSAEITLASIEIESRIVESTSITPNSDSLSTKRVSIETTRLIVQSEPPEYIDFTTGLQGTSLSLIEEVPGNKSSSLEESTIIDEGFNSQTIKESSSVASVSQSGRPETILTDVSTYQTQEPTRTTVVEQQMFKSTQPNGVTEYETLELGNFTVTLPVEYTRRESYSTEENTLTENTPLYSNAFTYASSDIVDKTKRMTEVSESFSKNPMVSNVTPSGKQSSYTERMTSLFTSTSEGENSSEYEVESSEKFLKSSTIGITSESESNFKTTTINDRSIEESTRIITESESVETATFSEMLSSTLNGLITNETGISSKEGSVSVYVTLITESPRSFEISTATTVSNRTTSKGKPGSSFHYPLTGETFSAESTIIPVTTAKYEISETSKTPESSSQITLTEDESIATREFENSYTLVEETGSDSTELITTTSREIILSTPLFKDTTDNESSLEETISTPYPFATTSLMVSSNKETEIPPHFTTVENATQTKTMNTEIPATIVSTLSSEDNTGTTVTEDTYETSESSGSVSMVSESISETKATEFIPPGILTKIPNDSESRSTETLTSSPVSLNTEATEITTVKEISSSYSSLTSSISSIKEGDLESSVSAANTEENLQSSTSALYIESVSTTSSSFSSGFKDSESTINPSSLLTTESEAEFRSSTIRGTELSITGSSDEFDEEVRGTSSTVATINTEEIPEENVKTSHYKENTKDKEEACDSTDIVNPMWYDYEENNVMTEASITTKKPISKTPGTKKVSQTTTKSLLTEPSNFEDTDETSATSITFESTGLVETSESQNTMQITSSTNFTGEIATGSTIEIVASSPQLTSELHTESTSETQSESSSTSTEAETISFSTEEYTLPPTEVPSLTTAPLPLDDTTETESVSPEEFTTVSVTFKVSPKFLAKSSERTTEFQSSLENDVSSGTRETEISTESIQSTSLYGEESTVDTFGSSRESVTLAYSTDTSDMSVEYSTASTMSSISSETKDLEAKYKTSVTDDWISEEMSFETRSSIDFGDDYRTGMVTVSMGEGGKAKIINELNRLRDQEKQIADKEEELRRKEIEWEKEREKLQQEIEKKNDVTESIETTREAITDTSPDRLIPGDMRSTIGSMDLESVSETGSQSDTTSLRDLSSTVEIFTVPTVFVSTTKDDVDEEIRALRRRLNEKEEELKERERRLLEREERLKKEKLEFEMQLEKVKPDEKVHQGEETEITMKSTSGTVVTSLDSEEVEKSVESVSVRASSPFVSPTPPTERSTINIWESTFARDVSLSIENCTTSAIDLEKGSSVSDEEENEEFHEVEDEIEKNTTTLSYEEKSTILSEETESQSTIDHTILPKLKEVSSTEESSEELITKKMCLNVLEDLPSGNRPEDLVTQKICLPFHFAKQEMPVGNGNSEEVTRPEEESRGIKYTKIDQLGEHEWEENTPQAATTRIKRDVSNFPKELRRSLKKQDWSYSDYRIRKNRQPLWEEIDSSDSSLCEDKLVTEAEYHVSWDSIPEDENPDLIIRETGLIDRNSVTVDPSWKFSPITEAEIHRETLYVTADQMEDTMIIKPEKSDLSVANEEDFLSEVSFQTDAYEVGRSTLKPLDYPDDLVNGEIKENVEKQFFSRFLPKREDSEKNLEDKTMRWVVEEKTSSSWNDQQSKTRMTPGPQWPTERMTAYHVGGTKTWNLEFLDARNRLNQGSVDGTTTCVNVIVPDPKDQSQEDYTEEEEDTEP